MPRIALALMVCAAVLVACLTAASATAAEKDPWVTYEGGDGPGKGKHLVFLAGDDEYRSEELMPQLAKIAAVRHGFTCTVVWAINPKTGEIDPSVKDHMPGVHLLGEADLMVMFLRFRALPPEQMKHIMDYTNSGKPMMGLRTSTHAFNYGGKSDNPYAKYSFRSKDPKGGYGRMVFGETWISHYGAHKRESTLGIIPPEAKDHPIVRGIEKVWGPSDVYGLTELEGDCKTIVLGQPLAGMTPDAPPNEKKKPIPVAWTKHFTGTSGKKARVFTTTMGHAHDLKNEGFRRLCINAIYWCLGMEDQIPAKANVDLVGEYDPAPIGMKGHKKGLTPDDFRMK
ncbi:MAG: ThuA domain-containing protein [Phycisphaerae bacterium]